MARLYPCLYLEEYLTQVDASVVRLCESLGVNEGVLFVQGLYDAEHNSFAIFEAGLRSASEAPYRFISDINGLNYMSLFVDSALGLEPDYDQSKEDPTLAGKVCGVVSFVAKGGVVGSITGLEEAVAATPSVVDYESRYPVGSETPDGDTLRQLMIRFVMECESREAMERDIAYLNSAVEVLDEAGHNMVLKMEPERVYGTK